MLPTLAESKSHQPCPVLIFVLSCDRDFTPDRIMTYDMRDFLVSCVDRYCELAKVDSKSLKHVATPFHDNRVARPTEEGEQLAGCS